VNGIGRFLLALLPLCLAACDRLGEANNTSGNLTTDFGNEASAGNEAVPADAVYCAPIDQMVTPRDCDAVHATREQVRRGVAAFNVPDPMQRGQSVSVQLVVDRRSPEEIARIDELVYAGPGRPAGPGDVGNAVDGGNASAGPDGPGRPTDLTVNSNGGDDPPSRPRPAPGGDDPTPAQLTDRLPGRTEQYTPNVGRFMRARLSGQGFRIVPRSDEVQEIPSNGSATWIWDVTAEQSGEKSLTLTTVVEAVVGNRRYPLANTQEIRTVRVDIRWRDRVWDALVAAPAWLKAIAALLTALGVAVVAWYGFLSKLRNRQPPA